MNELNLDDLKTLRLKVKRHDWKMDEFIKLAKESSLK